jgi:hypothetical protein
LINALPLDQNVQMTSRVGIVYFSSTATVLAQLNVYQNPSQAQAGIYAIPFSGDAGVDLEAYEIIFQFCLASRTVPLKFNV